MKNTDLINETMYNSLKSYCDQISIGIIFSDDSNHSYEELAKSIYICVDTLGIEASGKIVKEIINSLTCH